MAAGAQRRERLESDPRTEPGDSHEGDGVGGQGGERSTRCGQEGEETPRGAPRGSEAAAGHPAQPGDPGGAQEHPFRRVVGRHALRRRLACGQPQEPEEAGEASGAEHALCPRPHLDSELGGQAHEHDDPTRRRFFAPWPLRLPPGNGAGRRAR